MATYLCVKVNNTTKKFTAKESKEAGKPYLCVKANNSIGYFPLTTETGTGTKIKVKANNTTYEIVETYTTSRQITITTGTSYHTRESAYETVTNYDTDKYSNSLTISMCQYNNYNGRGNFSATVGIRQEDYGSLTLAAINYSTVKANNTFSATLSYNRSNIPFVTPPTQSKNLSKYFSQTKVSAYYLISHHAKKYSQTGIFLFSKYFNNFYSDTSNGVQIIGTRAFAVTNPDYWEGSFAVLYRFIYSNTEAHTRSSTSSTEYLTTTSSESYITE